MTRPNPESWLLSPPEAALAGCGKTRPRRSSGDFTSPHVLCFHRQHGDVKAPLHVFPQPVRVISLELLAADCWGMRESNVREGKPRRRWCSGRGHGRTVFDEQGSTLVEFAVVLVVLLTFLFGIMDFARYLYTYHFVCNAAREATRYAIVRGSTSGSTACASATTFGCNATAANVTSYVQSITPRGISPSALTVTTTWPGTGPAGAATACDTTNGNNSPGCLVVVQVSYPFKFILPFLPKSTWGMTSTSQMAISQ